MKPVAVIILSVLLVATVIFLAGVSVLVACTIGGFGFAGIVYWLSRE